MAGGGKATLGDDGKATLEILPRQIAKGLSDTRLALKRSENVFSVDWSVKIL